MNAGQFFSILRARWVLFVAVFGVIVGGTIIGSMLWPKKYTAVATVVVDVKPDPVAAFAYSSMMTPSLMATQVDVIQSDRVGLRVVRDLKLADNPQVRQQWRDETGGDSPIELWLNEAFQKNLDVKPSRESNVINVGYKAPDPRFAAALANAFVQAYLETTLELRVDPARQYSTFFDARAKQSRDVLEAAQTKLSAYQHDQGLIASDERMDVENARLVELSSQLAAVQALTAESTSRQAQAQGSSADKLQEVLNNPVVASLKADLSRAQAHLQELGAKYGDKHPQVQEARASIAELQQRIDAETHKVTGGVTLSNTINRQREVELRAAIDVQRAKVLKMKDVRDRGAVLQRDVENAQHAYELISGRSNQATLESQTTQSNVYPLTSATPPLEPSSPRLILNLLIALFLGIVLGVGAVLAREIIDRRVRSTDDLVAALGLPVLGVMPKPSARRLFHRTGSLSLMQQRVLGHSPASGNGAA